MLDGFYIKMRGLNPCIARSDPTECDMCPLCPLALTLTLTLTVTLSVVTYPTQDPQRGGGHVPERRIAIEHLEEKRTKVLDLRLPTERHAAPHRQCLEDDETCLCTGEAEAEVTTSIGD